MSEVQGKIDQLEEIIRIQQNINDAHEKIFMLTQDCLRTARMHISTPTGDNKRELLALTAGWTRKYSEAKKELRWYDPELKFNFFNYPDAYNNPEVVSDIEAKLTDVQWKTYTELLLKDIPEEAHKRRLLTLTTAQKAEALGKILNLW